MLCAKCGECVHAQTHQIKDTHTATSAEPVFSITIKIQHTHARCSQHAYYMDVCGRTLTFRISIFILISPSIIITAHMGVVCVAVYGIYYMCEIQCAFAHTFNALDSRRSVRYVSDYMFTHNIYISKNQHGA